MNKKHLRLGGTVVLIGVALLSLAWAAPQDRARKVTHRWIQQFGMVTPAAGQTLRLHAVNMGFELPPDPVVPGESDPPEPDTPPDPISPPDPCRVVLAFYDAAGRMIGSPVRKTLAGRASTFIDLSFERTEGGLPPGPCRASVWVLRTTPVGETPPDPCKASLEILDTASGRASLHMLPAVQHALPAVQH